MTTSPVQIATCTNITLDQILESAVVLNWKDLLPGTRTNLVHLEYRLGPDVPLEFLKVWSSITRGHQYLVCNWMCTPSSVASHVTFSNDFYSKDLAQMLESILQHQAAFSTNLTLHRDGLVQVHPPTEEDQRTAEAHMAEAFHWFVALRQDRRHYTE
jgi:hypothetical protein